MKIILCAIATLLLSGTAHANIVNLQRDIAQATKDGVSGGINLTGEASTGNTMLVRGSLSGDIYHKSGRYLGLLALKGSYGFKGNAGRFDPAPFDANTFIHLRIKAQVFGPMSVEFFAQHEFDMWRRLELRALGGAGLRVDKRLMDAFSISGGVSIMPTWEKLSTSAVESSSDVLFELRISTYLFAAWKITDTVNAMATVYWQPLFSDPQDSRIMLDLVVEVDVAKNLALVFEGVLQHDTRPPAGVLNLDTASKIGIRYKF